MRIDADGSVYIAVYGAGLIVHRKAGGTIRHIQVPMKYVTSIALSPKQIAITGANDNQSRPYPGQVIVVDRGTFEGSDRIGF